jgi:hypothetical protein
MLQNLSTQVKECYRRAAESRANAERASDPKFKAAFLDMEERWLALARSYELSESLSMFTNDLFHGRFRR